MVKALPHRHIKGFTLIELIIVIVVLGILAAYATFNASPAELTLPAQAERMASDIRQVQTLAYTTGQRMLFETPNGTNITYTAKSCNASNVCTPVVLSGSLEKGLALSGTTSVHFSTLGQPTAAATYTLSIDGSSKTISVAALTGFVTVTP